VAVDTRGSMPRRSVLSACSSFLARCLRADSVFSMVSRAAVVWIVVVLALAAAIASSTARGGFRRYVRLQSDVNSLKEKNFAVSAENRKLRQEVTLLKSDLSVVERAAREELGLTRPGEKVFRFEAP
jgi:cell division protein FtsB